MRARAGADSRAPPPPPPALNTPRTTHRSKTIKAAELLSRGAEPNCRDKARLTPAHYAASKAAVDVLAYLAAKGADLDAEDERGRTPLHYAGARVFLCVAPRLRTALLRFGRLNTPQATKTL